MIPLGGDLETLYGESLRRRHPRTWAHYIAWVRSLRRAVAGREHAGSAELEIWLESRRGETRRAARKGIRKYLRWLDECGLGIPCPPSLARTAPDRTLAPVLAQRLRRRQSGTVVDRQIFTMVALHSGTELPAAAIGQLRAEHLTGDGAQIVWRGTAHPLPPEAWLALGRWLRVRERLRVLPEEQRRHRKSDAWTHSPFLFPNTRGQASGHGVIWRARRTPAPVAVGSPSDG